MKKTAIILPILMLASGLYAQETIADEWSKLMGITTHTQSPYPIIVTDEVSAGWDFDGDGNLEFLVLTDHSNPNGGGPEYTTGASLYLYEANASGGFDLNWWWWDTTLGTGGASFPVHCVADLDGDSKPEILLGMPYGTGNPPDQSNPSRFYVWEGGASGLPAWSGTTPPAPTATWNFGVSVGSNTRPSGMAAGDIDADGVQEVAVAFRAFSDASVNDAVMIFSLNGAFAGTFTSWTEELIDTTSDFGSIYCVTITDVDGDGMNEAFIPSFSTDIGFFWEGTGVANVYNMYSIDGSPNWLGGLHSIGSFDADNDGVAEVFVGNGQGNFVVIDGVTDLATASPSDVYAIDNQGTGFRGMAVGDFDGDGNCDLFSGGNYLSNVTHWEYNGSGAITDSASWTKTMVYQQDTSGASRTYSVAFGGASDNGGTTADLNGDGYNELIIGFEDGDSTATQYVVVLTNDGVIAIDGEFGDPVLHVYRLAPNYPNPFNPSTSISFSMTRAGQVELAVYDLAGRHIRTLVSGALEAGEHSAVWDGQDAHNQPVASGVYLYRLEVNGTTLTRQMTLLK